MRGLIIILLFSACKATQPELTLVDTIPYNDFHRLDSVALVANRVLKPIPGRQTFAVYEEVKKPAKKNAKTDAVEVVSSEGATVFNIGKKGKLNVNWHSPGGVAAQKNKPDHSEDSGISTGTALGFAGMLIAAGVIVWLVIRYLPRP